MIKFKPIQPKPIVAIAVSLLLLSACQKKPETEVEPEATVSVATSVSTEEVAADQDNQNNEANTTLEQEDTSTANQLNDKAEAEKDTAASENEDSTVEAQPSLAGAQVTDVRYKSEDGTTISVVFETSRDGLLNAIVSFPNQPKITLTAPEGQGNNPTYHSKDGSIELVSHEGGSSIDLIQDGNITNFTAISADAAVITQS